MRKGSKKEGRIEYPRSCGSCSKVFTTPAGWYYHQNTHVEPSGQLCSYGCGLLAVRQTSGGVWCCSDNGNQCPSKRAEISERVTNDWKKTERIRPGHLMMSFSEEKRKLIGKKGSDTKRKKLLSQDNTSCRKRYNRVVHTLSQQALKWNESINPQNLPFGRDAYHLDHQVSKHVGYLLNIPPEIIADAANLKVIASYNNTSKGFRCSKHPLYLLKEVGASPDLISQVEQTIAQLGDLFEQLLTPHKPLRESGERHNLLPT